MEVEYDFKELYEFSDRLNDLTRFNECATRIVRDISKALLKWMKSYTPVDTYELIHGWDDASKVVVVKKNTGYEVLLVNKTPYAVYVNDGHKSYNQYGGAYPIKPYNPHGAWGKPEGRIQVRSPHKWQEGDATWYVFGHFFVERGIVRLTDTKELDAILCKELEKWWEGCLHG